MAKVVEVLRCSEYYSTTSLGFDCCVTQVSTKKKRKRQKLQKETVNEEEDVFKAGVWHWSVLTCFIVCLIYNLGSIKQNNACVIRLVFIVIQFMHNMVLKISYYVLTSWQYCRFHYTCYKKLNLIKFHSGFHSGLQIIITR